MSIVFDIQVAGPPPIDDDEVSVHSTTRTVETELYLSTAQSRVREHLEARGFVEKTNRGDTMVFQRGSLLWNMIALSPRKLKTAVSVTWTVTDGRTRANIALEVTTTGQVVLDKDREYWEAEADAATQCLLDDGRERADPDALHARATKHNKSVFWRMVGYSVVFAILFGGVGVALTFLVGLPPLTGSALAGAGAGVGVAVAMARSR